eukprot:CAMPEP_0184985208 /NCGR_PEP_ID=MMETSP1098-20130426/13997_1 /TAXON_ID=89044 /ORGANISM="Spumella elongata, Strain CCAP 955/1" /LENGTH=106 /DNA_ID=CAMNT_0027509285 /DNA_START=1 /DNA_END=321 /DNA_ORIENTATION=-
MLQLLHYTGGADADNDTSTGGIAFDSSDSASESAENTSESTQQCVLYAPVERIDELLLKYPEGKLPVQPEKLHWAPFYVTDPKKDKWSIKSMRDKGGKDVEDVLMT